MGAIAQCYALLVLVLVFVIETASGLRHALTTGPRARAPAARHRRAAARAATLSAPEVAARPAAEAAATLTFSGCGGLYVYFFGVAAHIQEHFDLRDVTIASASAGAFPAFLLAADIPVADFHARENRALLRAVAAAGPGGGARPALAPLGGWNEHVRRRFARAIDDRLGPGAYRAANGRLHISLTEVPSLANVLVSEYESNADLVDGFIASAFVPIYGGGRAWAAYRGRRYVDGGLSDNAPVPPARAAAGARGGRRRGAPPPALVLTPYKWREGSGFPLIRADVAWADEMFARGREDARRHHDELAAVLPPKRDPA